MSIPEPLSARQVQERLAALPGWSGDTDGISKVFSIDYHAGVRIVIGVAEAAKEMGHHPDIDIRWDRLRFAITTHDAGHKVTELDLLLAERIDEVAADYGAASA